MKERFSEFYDFLENEGVITIPDVKENIIEKFIEEHKVKSDELEDIADIVSHHTGITVFDMKQKTRKRFIKESRQLAMYMMATYTKKSYSTIGQFFRHRNHVYDHATVSNSIKVVNNLSETDSEYKAVFKKIRDDVKTWI